MKQCVLALHNYHDVHNSLPGGTMRFGWWYVYGTHVAMLPFIEESSRYAELYQAWINAGGNIYGVGPGLDDTPATYPALGGTITPYLCPSDTNSKKPGPRGGHARCNMVINHGDYVSETRELPPEGFRGLFAYCFNGHNGTGKEQNYLSFSGITDGLSNTLAISETATAPIVNSKAIRGGIINLSTAIITDVSDCRNAKDTTNPSMMSGTPPANVYRGNSFLCGAIAWLGFTTILPPNSPTCTTDYPGYTYRDSDGGIFTPNSFHSGGVNVGVADGSIVFISETINATTANNAANVTEGASNFGVWGNLGVRNDGVPVSVK
jgi:hypothetical protein